MAPFKLAIVGAGPSAFYVASRLLTLLPSSSSHAVPFRIHMYDRLWAPHGLVRYGVAPDHPEVKNCTSKFDLAASDPRFRFFGNVNVADLPNAIPHALNLPLSTIRSHYTHVLFATGCTLPVLHPQLAPSKHCVPAISLVHWYTRHPSRPPPPPLDNVSHVSLIGHGNVSLDVARMLLTNPDTLAKYDVPASVLDVLSRSSVRHVSIIGRRGPLEAAFTTKELREMMNLPEASLVPIDPRLLVTPTDASSLSRQQSRLMQIFQKGSKNAPGTTRKTWSLEFFRSPVGLSVAPSGDGSATLSLSHTALDPTTRRAVDTGERSTLSTSLVITSLGFRSEPLAPFYDSTLGHLRVVAGRVVVPSSSSSTSDASVATLKNVYASGWAATGAKGVLASTMMDAYAVADTILSDWLPSGESVRTTPVSALSLDSGETSWMMNAEPHPDDPPPEIQAGLRDGLVTEYSDWKGIDEEERKRGQAVGKERERMGWEEARTFLAMNS